MSKPSRILTKEQRNDPFADPPPITDNDLQDGMINLLNRGIIPKDVDLTPAFNRGANPFNSQPMKYSNYLDSIKRVPLQLKTKYKQEKLLLRLLNMG